MARYAQSQGTRKIFSPPRQKAASVADTESTTTATPRSENSERPPDLGA